MGDEGGMMPVCYRFQEPLTVDEFQKWVDMLFPADQKSPLWGNPITLGPTKRHAYGWVRNSDTRFSLEMTEHGFVVMKQGCKTIESLIVDIENAFTQACGRRFLKAKQEGS